MISKERIIRRINEIEKELSSLKAELESGSSSGGGTLMGKYAFLPDISDDELLGVKKIWEPKNSNGI